MCAVASFSRETYNITCGDSSPFREALDYFPTVRDIVLDFYQCNFGRALNTVKEIESTMLLDPHIYSVVTPLIKAIRLRAITQYIIPFTTVRLSSLSFAMEGTEREFEDEIIELIEQDQIEGRLDLINKALYANPGRSKTHRPSAANVVNNDFMEQIQDVLLKMALRANYMTVGGCGRREWTELERHAEL